MVGAILEVKGRLLGRAAKGGLWEKLGPCRSRSSLDRKIFQTVRKGSSVSLCGVLLLPLQLGFWRSDTSCFGAGPWRVAKETVGQLQRYSQKRGEWVTQAPRHHTPSPLHEEALRDPFPLDLTEAIVFILPLLDRAVLPSPQL